MFGTTGGSLVFLVYSDRPREAMQMVIHRVPVALQRGAELLGVITLELSMDMDCVGMDCTGLAPRMATRRMLKQRRQRVAPGIHAFWKSHGCVRYHACTLGSSMVPIPSRRNFHHNVHVSSISGSRPSLATVSLDLRKAFLSLWHLPAEWTVQLPPLRTPPMENG